MPYPTIEALPFCHFYDILYCHFYSGQVHEKAPCGECIEWACRRPCGDSHRTASQHGRAQELSTYRVSIWRDLRTSWGGAGAHAPDILLLR